jgi:hypothetical protein
MSNVEYLEISELVSEKGWYFWDETGDAIGPWKNKWAAEKVFSAYIFNVIEGQDFLHLHLDKFLQLSR